MKTLLTIGTIYHLGFAVFHMFFWRLFRWKSSLRLTTPLNRAVMQVMNLCLIYVFLFLAYVSFFQQAWLFSNKIMLIFIAGFWIFRAALQILFFDRNKPFSIALTIIFLAGTVLYLIPMLNF
jgi:hypothetical protein